MNEAKSSMSDSKSSKNAALASGRAAGYVARTRRPHVFELAARMQDAIAADDYETAAIIRDEVVERAVSGDLSAEAVDDIMRSKHEGAKLAFRPAT